LLRKAIILMSLAVIFVPSTANSEEGERLKIGTQAPKFTLKDADDKEHSLDPILNKDKASAKVIILVMGDRSVREPNDKWAIELDKIYGKKKEVTVLMIADLRGLPFFATEGMVKWGVKREKIPATILLDWGGKVNKLYKAQRGKPNLFVIGYDSKILYHYVGPYSAESIKEIQTKVQENLSEKKKKGA